MERKVASRRLQRACVVCEKGFSKGEVYYRDRQVQADDEGVCAVETLRCARCVYEDSEHAERFNQFKETCEHPEDFVGTQYQYIPGEYVKEPSHDECLLCGQAL